jgi:hypothetical protein
MLKARTVDLSHLMTIDDAERLAARYGATTRTNGDRLEFFEAGKLVGSTLIDGNIDGVPTVTRHTVNLILKTWRTADESA